VIPGALLIFIGLLLAAWADGFARVGAVGLSIIGALGLLSWGADFAATVMGAKRVGASPLALAGATIGGLVGLFLGLAGLVLGPFVGAVAGELIARRNLAPGWQGGRRHLARPRRRRGREGGAGVHDDRHVPGVLFAEYKIMGSESNSAEGRPPNSL
jgi:hypothetical protein